MPQDWPAQRRVFAQGQVDTRSIVIVGAGAQQPTQMSLVEDDQMIQALSTDRPDKPFVNGGVKMYRRGGIKMYQGLGGSLSP